MKNIKRKMGPIVVSAALLGMGIVSFIVKDREYSEKENRRLAAFPKMNIESLSDGSFMDGFETYLSDQFPLRDACLSVRTNLMKSVGVRKINEVYIAEDGYLMAVDEKLNEAATGDIIVKMNALASEFEEVNFSLMLVPNAGSIYRDKLPYGARLNQEKTIEFVGENLSDRIKYFDVSSVLSSHVDEQLYYRTDHHWTTNAAYYAMQEYLNRSEIDTEAVEYDRYTVSNKFQGTLSSKTGITSIFDNIEVIVPKGSEGTYIAKYVTENVKKSSLYDVERIDEKNQYEVFMGGDFSQIDITTVADNEKVLMILKDSYADCLIPMLTPYYSRIIVIDPRYYFGDLRALIKSDDVTDVLYLYNVNSFVTDMALGNTLK